MRRDRSNIAKYYSIRGKVHTLIHTPTGTATRIITGWTPSTTVGNASGFLQYNLVDTVSGSTNPRWREQVANGENATTACTGDRFSFQNEFLTFGGQRAFDLNPNTAQSQHYADSWDYYGYDVVNTGPGGVDINSLDAATVTSVNNRAIADFYQKAKEASSAFEAGQDLGELKETIHSIIHPLGSLRNHVEGYFVKLKKARRAIQQAKSPIKALTDTYLEFRFGWNPLASDVVDAIAKIPMSRPATVAITGKGSKVYSTKVGSNLASGGWTNTGLIFRYNTGASGRYSVRYKGAVRTHADKVNGRIGLARNLQFLPQDWLPTAWDLLPYSWIADYFSNVGDIISAISFPSSNIAWVCKTDHNKTTFERTVVSVDPVGQPPSTVNYSESRYIYGGHYLNTETRFTRSPTNPSAVLPTFALRLPTSFRPWENIGALLLSRAGGLTPLFTPRGRQGIRNLVGI